MPKKLKYSKDHEWVKVSGNTAYVGITDFAQSELGDIIYVEVETVGQLLQQDEILGTVEAVKTVSDLFMPVSGKIIAFNKDLETNPETINRSPYDAGWIIQIELSQPDELKNLMCFEEYNNHTLQRQ
ncbi:MAG: glycine cleavage system protein GcvH [Flavobacteriales bacterium Tduv]